MIKAYSCFQLNGVKIETNYSEESKPCKEFKITIGDQVGLVSHKDMYSLLMLFGEDEEQVELIPHKESKVKSITRLLTIRAKKDIKEGEAIQFPYKYMVPEEEYEKLIKLPSYLSDEKPLGAKEIVA